jgi:hypothetical protein
MPLGQRYKPKYAPATPVAEASTLLYDPELLLLLSTLVELDSVSGRGKL